MFVYPLIIYDSVNISVMYIRGVYKSCILYVILVSGQLSVFCLSEMHYEIQI
jgi:hypothetical protein